MMIGVVAAGSPSGGAMEQSVGESTDTAPTENELRGVWHATSQSIPARTGAVPGLTESSNIDGWSAASERFPSANAVESQRGITADAAQDTIEQFDVTIDEEASRTSVSAGEQIEIVATIENTGDASDEQTVELIIDGVTRDEQTVQLDESERTQITLGDTVTLEDDGETVFIQSRTESEWIEITVDGGSQAGLSVTPRSLSFGNNAVGETGVRELVVSNQGSEVVDIGELQIQGQNPAAFAIEAPIEEVNPGEEAVIDLSFTPPEAGQFSAGLVIFHSASTEPTTVALEGTTASGELSVNRQSIKFTDVAVGETGTGSVGVANTGNAAIAIETIALQAGEDFTIVSDPPAVLDPGEQFDVTVQFQPTAAGAVSDFLLVRSNASSGGTAAVTLTSGDVDLEVDVDEGRTTTRATIENVSAGSSTRVPIPETAPQETYQTEAVSVTPAVDTDVGVNITSSSRSLPSSPETSDGLAPNTARVGNISATTTVAPEDISNVTFRTRINRSQLEAWDTDAGNVSLFRFDPDAGRWIEQATDVVETAPESVVLRTTSDGFSEWTAAAARPEFTIASSEVDVTVASVDENVSIQVFVENTGGTEGTYVANLVLNDEVIASQEALIADGGEELFQFQQRFADPGTYEIYVNEAFIEEVEISAGDENGDDGGTNESAEDVNSGDADSSGDGFGAGIPVVAILLASGGILVKTRRRY